jgi:anti-sigma factor RsiW
MLAGCADVRQALGVYVVGAIDPAERAFVGQHLATCPGCRAEFAGLARLPALLGRVTLDEVERAPAQAPPAVFPPERLLTPALSEVTRLRRTRPNPLSAAAAGAVIPPGAGTDVLRPARPRR